jgi:hypothetical protein
VDRVLGSDDEERFRQAAGSAVGGHLVLLHGLEQRALTLRSRPVDLIGQHDLSEQGPLDETEVAGVALEDRRADDVRRQQSLVNWMRL